MGTVMTHPWQVKTLSRVLKHTCLPAYLNPQKAELPYFPHYKRLSLGFGAYLHSVYCCQVFRSCFFVATHFWT